MSENTRQRLAVIIGSTRAGRFGPTVAGWFAAEPAGVQTWTST
ncbi:NAD(P)H-dependent oxidoreductase [Dactylosporangium fulvum]|uniref:NAD(P)H-dependent oxidoreductase n=1 Tax=Dactylosporangium fulvum TaxID=53359 RepID=A0ABY5VX03_9ACTN|nr:NAD(P)H-dependent oxidoreductase [Dactylosporangium fulvum]UWP80321.1 NAD(P)H-dependent oxidoreductase [Dactylosporangium fulvum]